jgi:hypothetical protein
MHPDQVFEARVLHSPAMFQFRLSTSGRVLCVLLAGAALHTAGLVPPLEVMALLLFVGGVALDADSPYQDRYFRNERFIY